MIKCAEFEINKNIFKIFSIFSKSNILDNYQDKSQKENNRVTINFLF